MTGQLFPNAKTDIGQYMAATLARATIGGVASVAGGGKFANGALTGAYQYLATNSFEGRKDPLDAMAQVQRRPWESGGGGGVPRGNLDLGLMIGAAVAMASGASSSGTVDGSQSQVHGNSADSMKGTELYYLINNDTGAIDRIGITSRPDERYSQAYLQAENVTYVTQAYYTWRYAAMVDENIRLTFYRFEHGQLPRLNKVTR